MACACITRRPGAARRSSLSMSSAATCAAGSRRSATSRASIAASATTRGFAEYLAQFNEHSALGSANTLLGVQCRRPSFYDLVERLQNMTVPTFLMLGDEEEPALEANILLKRCIPTAGLAVLPRSGHAINLEEPALFNQLLENFLHQVELGKWRPRNARSLIPSIYG